MNDVIDDIMVDHSNRVMISSSLGGLIGNDLVLKLSTSMLTYAFLESWAEDRVFKSKERKLSSDKFLKDFDFMPVIIYKLDVSKPTYKTMKQWYKTPSAYRDSERYNNISAFLRNSGAGISNGIYKNLYSPNSNGDFSTVNPQAHNTRGDYLKVTSMMASYTNKDGEIGVAFECGTNTRIRRRVGVFSYVFVNKWSYYEKGFIMKRPDYICNVSYVAEDYSHKVTMAPNQAICFKAASNTILLHSTRPLELLGYGISQKSCYISDKWKLATSFTPQGNYLNIISCVDDMYEDDFIFIRSNKYGNVISMHKF